MRALMTILCKFILGTSILCGVSGFAAWQYLKSWAETPIQTPSTETQVVLSPGMPLPKFAELLENKQIISEKHLFIAFVKFSRTYAKFQAGTYLFSKPASPAQICQRIIAGDNYTPITLQVVIPEGFTLKLLNNRLISKNVGKSRELQDLVINRKFLRSLGVNSTSLEGFTYPATYNFEKMPSPEEFYRKVVKNFFENLPENYEEQVRTIGLSLVEAVTFASLIELETMREDEKPMISEVIHARLRKREALGIDAAIIYGIHNYDGDLKWSDLKDPKNPYNTRIHRGLPPTPIGAVSKSSLLAVLNPTNMGYYYYVLDGEDNTRHLFSKTLSEHNRKVQLFLKARGQQEIRGNSPPSDR